MAADLSCQVPHGSSNRSPRNPTDRPDRARLMRGTAGRGTCPPSVDRSEAAMSTQVNALSRSKGLPVETPTIVVPDAGGRGSGARSQACGVATPTCTIARAGSATTTVPTRPRAAASSSRSAPGHRPGRGRFRVLTGAPSVHCRACRRGRPCTASPPQCRQKMTLVDGTPLSLLWIGAFSEEDAGARRKCTKVYPSAGRRGRAARLRRHGRTGRGAEHRPGHRATGRVIGCGGRRRRGGRRRWPARPRSFAVDGTPPNWSGPRVFGAPTRSTRATTDPVPRARN